MPGMRRVILGAALLLVAGCGKKEVPAGAIKVALSFQGFGPGCVTVSAQDGAGHSASTTLSDVARESQKVIALEGTWGAGLTVTGKAYERTCDGTPVAEQTKPVTVPETGVENLALTLSAPDADQDGFVASSAGGSDCDDSAGGATIHPGAAEVCDGKDDNCNGSVDEDLPQGTYYRDADHDSYGDAATEKMACAKPGADWVTRAGDCDDGNDAVHPGATELCNGVDDDCSGAADEAFQIGMACFSNGCEGAFACNGPDANACVAPAYYADTDGDGHGAGAALSICPVDGSAVTSDDDCDDADAATYPGAPDICDQRDNSCGTNATVDPSCESDVWAAHTQTSTGAGWNTASAYAKGKVWFAGASGALARADGTTLSDHTADCVPTLQGNWHASWADGTGKVYLAGEDPLVAGQGLVVTVDGTTCQQDLDFTAPGGILYGLAVLPGTSAPDVFVTADNGAVYRSDGTSPTAPGATKLLGIHGADGLLITVGQLKSGPNTFPAAYRFNFGNGKWGDLNVKSVAGLSAAASTLRAVHVLDATHAYLVGEAGTLLVFDGATLTAVPRPADATNATSFNSVLALSPTAVYVVDSDQKVRRWDGQAWQTLDGSGGQPLNDITGVAADDLWVAGDGDLILHWHESP
jgi:hypothetical protein